MGDVTCVDLTATIEKCWHNVPTEQATLEIKTDQRIRADESQLKLLVENLLRNAVEHGGADVTITIGQVDDGFYFGDDGAGIPSENRDAVF